MVIIVPISRLLKTERLTVRFGGLDRGHEIWSELEAPVRSCDHVLYPFEIFASLGIRLPQEVGGKGLAELSSPDICIAYSPLSQGVYLKYMEVEVLGGSVVSKTQRG